MQDKENIEELFKEAFRNFEEPVRPELWSKISNSIQSAPVGTDPTTVVNSTLSTGSGIMSSAAIWVAGAALVVLSGIGVYYAAFQNSTEESATEKINNKENIYSNIEVTAPSQSQETVVNTDPFENLETSVTPVKTDNGLKEISSVESGSSVSDQSGSSENTVNKSDNKNSTPQHITQPEFSSPATQPKSLENNNPEAASTVKPSVTEAQFRANPLSGNAPLTVDFTYTGEAQKTEWQFGDGLSSVQFNNSQHTFDKPGNYSVTLKVYDELGQVTLLNKNIKVLADLQIRTIPNIFTPNGDGRNDVFTFETPNLTDLEVSIYDQSGKFVHKWVGLEGGWDGKLNSGDPAVDGTYFYIIFATGQNQQKHQQKGTIILKR